MEALAAVLVAVVVIFAFIYANKGKSNGSGSGGGKRPVMPEEPLEPRAPESQARD
jgi:hypothetical protein